MAGISFDEDQQAGNRVPSQIGKPSSFIRLVRKTGLAKTDKGANYVLIIGTIIILAIAIWILAGTYAPRPAAPPLSISTGARTPITNS